MSDFEHQDTMQELPDDPLTKALRTMSFHQAVESLGADALKNALLDKFSVYDQGRRNIEEQLCTLKDQVAKDNTAIAQRVDKLISLMTNNAVFIRQMIDLLDDYGNKLSKYEKDAVKHQMEYAAVVDKMNRMAKNFVKLENNQKEIVDELECLKQRQDEDDKFKWKVTAIMIIVSPIIGWLCVGDHLRKCVIIFQKFLFNE